MTTPSTWLRRGARSLAIVYVLGWAITTPSLAQFDPLTGTWSGHWDGDSPYTSCTVRFAQDDGHAGELLNPTRLDFRQISFDPDTLRVTATADSPEHGLVMLDATIEDDTRLNGTLTIGDTTGDLRLTKWTYRP